MAAGTEMPDGVYGWKRWSDGRMKMGPWRTIVLWGPVFSCLFCINDSDIPDYPDLLHILSILYIRKSNRHPVINRVY